jgi:membrane protein YdbS with pleckstrin-like domain
MENRSLGKVFILTIITFGFYGLYWHVKTKGEMNARGAAIPTAWLLIVPFINIWWLWKYADGVEMVTDRKLSTAVGFLILWLLGIIGMVIVQDAFNKVGPAVANANLGGPVIPTSPASVPPIAVLPTATSPTPDSPTPDSSTPQPPVTTV